MVALKPHRGPPRCGECHGPLSQGAGAASRRLPAEQLVEIDIALAGRPDVADLETVGLEPIFHQPHFLGADPVLPRV